jgi:hypothetical protein
MVRVAERLRVLGTTCAPSSSRIAGQWSLNPAGVERRSQSVDGRKAATILRLTLEAVSGHLREH